MTLYDAKALLRDRGVNNPIMVRYYEAIADEIERLQAEHDATLERLGKVMEELALIKAQRVIETDQMLAKILAITSRGQLAQQYATALWQKARG